jgi:hypothetical protein
MAITELKEALNLLTRLPSLWIPGIVGGILTAALWLTLNLSGTFFAGRLLVIFGLVLLLFTTGLLVIIRNNEGDLRTMISGGIRYYFRVLLPQIIIIFGIMLIVTLVMVTFSLIGGLSDIGMVTALTIGFMIPIVILTFFYDTAAVFEERKVFDSIRRSIQLVMLHINEVIAFLLICAAITIGVIFMLMIIWEAFLFDKLEPITRYNTTQLQTFTPEQFIAMIGLDGIWITAVILFIGVFLLLPLLYSYKACFFRNLIRGAPVAHQPTTGEFDSKGRWFKY